MPVRWTSRSGTTHVFDAEHGEDYDDAAVVEAIQDPETPLKVLQEILNQCASAIVFCKSTIASLVERFAGGQNQETLRLAPSACYWGYIMLHAEAANVYIRVRNNVQVDERFASDRPFPSFASPLQPQVYARDDPTNVHLEQFLRITGWTVEQTKAIPIQGEQGEQGWRDTWIFPRTLSSTRPASTSALSNDAVLLKEVQAMSSFFNISTNDALQVLQDGRNLEAASQSSLRGTGTDPKGKGKAREVSHDKEDQAEESDTSSEDTSVQWLNEAEIGRCFLKYKRDFERKYNQTQWHHSLGARE